MVPTTLLRTKFLIPRHKPERLSRAHLLAWLEHNSDKRLILLSAPPGYGKTTLLTDFASTSRLPLAWYQLDAVDGDPATFLAYLIECMRGLHPAFATMGDAARALLNGEDAAAVSPARILTVLINDLAELSVGDWVLVLEDYHFITNPAIHALVDYLLDSGPPGLHLIISTRGDPPLALPRLRARGLLAELRSADLRFTDQEVSQWLSACAPELSQHSARVLSEKTEGWAAGLQLALSSLADQDPASAERFIADLSGAHRFIFEYLAEEVFRRQPPEIQRFLLYTAVLTQMNAAVCNALLGAADAQATLELIEQQNLFVVSLDEHREWFRYHHLFHEFLLGKLRRDHPSEIMARDRAAGAYYESRGEMEAALTHYLQGNDPESAARVIAAFAPDYIERGRVEVLQRYFSLLPESVIRARPELLLYHGDALRRFGQAGAAATRYEDARLAFETCGDSVGVSRALTELAELARSQGDYRRARSLAASAVESPTPQNRHAVRARALMALAKSEGFLVGMDRGRALAEKALAEARRAGDSISPRARAALLRSLGQICWWHGDPQATVRYCQEALQSIPDELSPIAAEALITMATPHLYWRDLDVALQCAERGLEIAQRLQLNELLPIAYATLGNVVTRRGKTARAESCLRQAMEFSRGLGLETYAQVMAAGFLAYNLCGQGRVDEARQLIETAMWPYMGSSDTYEICVCRSVLADIALESGQMGEAERLFESLLEVDRRRQYRIPLAMVCFGLAYVYLTTGRKRQGLELATESLQLLEPTGALQLYLDQGERARVVSEALLGAGLHSVFLSRVLEAQKAAPVVEVTAAISPTVTVRCLGQFRVVLGAAEVTADQWVSAKARDLLAYFVTFRRERVSSERAIDALWPDKVGRSKTAFHTALYRLRHALRAPDQSPNAKFVLVESGEYRLDTARFSVDVDEFDAALTKARSTHNDEAAQWYERAASLYCGEYLDNLYYDWVLPERQRLREAYLSALRTLASFRAATGDYEAASALAQRALQVDSLLEDIHCDVMRYYAASGNRSAVVRQYQVLQQVLKDELGMQPLPATQQLYASLLNRPVQPRLLPPFSK
jgi:LuxR family maltose regulon positive regulatory protein